jgi:hypothetical protein
MLDVLVTVAQQDLTATWLLMRVYQMVKRMETVLALFNRIAAPTDTARILVLV